MDELLPKLKIHQVRTPLMSREFLVLYAASTSYLVDRAARIAALLGGLAFTGSGKHFVKYRDDRVAARLRRHRALRRAGRLRPLRRHLHAGLPARQGRRVRAAGLPPVAAPAAGHAAPTICSDRELLWLRRAHRPRALACSTYLWRNRVRAEAAFVEPADTAAGAGSFGQGAGIPAGARARSAARACCALFAAVPGVEVFRPVGDNVRRAGRLSPSAAPASRARRCSTRSASTSSPATRDAVDVLTAPPPLVPAADLIGGGFDLGERGEPVEHTPREPDKLEVQLKLVASASARRRVTATLVPWAHADRLRKLVYALPPTMLATYRVAAIAEGLFVIGEQGIDGCPSATCSRRRRRRSTCRSAWSSTRASAPRCSPITSAASTGATWSSRAAARPLALEHAAFEPLGRRALARLEVDPRTRDARMPPPRATTPATVVNEELGSLPLWGFAADTSADQEARLAPWRSTPPSGCTTSSCRWSPAATCAWRTSLGARELKHARRGRLRSRRERAAHRRGAPRHRRRAGARRRPSRRSTRTRCAWPRRCRTSCSCCTRARNAPSVTRRRLRAVSTYADAAGDAAAARPRPRRLAHGGARARRAPLDAAPPVRPRPRRRARQLLGRQARVPRRRAAGAPAQVARRCAACARSAGASPSSARRWPTRSCKPIVTALLGLVAADRSVRAVAPRAALRPHAAGALAARCRGWRAPSPIAGSAPGLPQVAGAYTAALMALYNDKEPRARDAARTATAFACHVQLLSLARRSAAPTERDHLHRAAGPGAGAAGRCATSTACSPPRSASASGARRRGARPAPDAPRSTPTPPLVRSSSGPSALLELVGVMARGVGPACSSAVAESGR